MPISVGEEAMRAPSDVRSRSPRPRRSTLRGLIGQERILVNCAGTGNAFETAGRDRESGEIRHFPLDAFERIIQINLIGTFRCIAKSAAGMLTLPPLDDDERGVIVNTASVAAEDGQVG
jgi:NAD(P)-dependent dehydrogenase (short-subunit alcohol dehydrogenase family)